MIIRLAPSCRNDLSIARQKAVWPAVQAIVWHEDYRSSLAVVAAGGVRLQAEAALEVEVALDGACSDLVGSRIQDLDSGAAQLLQQ